MKHPTEQPNYYDPPGAWPDSTASPHSGNLPISPSMLPAQPKEDSRPQRYGWAPGKYLNHCRSCTDDFIGDKRAIICADCAYALPDPSKQSPTQPPELTAERLEERIEDAQSRIGWMCRNGKPPRMSIPARPDVDDDLVITQVLMDCSSQLHSLRSELATAKDRIVELESAIRYIHKRNGHLGDWVDDGTYLKWLDDKCSELLSHSTKAEGENS